MKIGFTLFMNRINNGTKLSTPKKRIKWLENKKKETWFVIII